MTKDEKKLAEIEYNKILKMLESSTIYNSDLEEETIKFYQKRPDVFFKTKCEIINDYKKNKGNIIKEMIFNDKNLGEL